MAAGPTPRSGILDIAPYIGGDAKILGHATPIRLASNESALGPSPKAIVAYRDLAGTLHRYPDGSAHDLRATLGRIYGLEPSRIVCGAGSDELIGLLTRAYAGPGDEVLYSRHGFLMYPIAAKASGATPIAVPEKDLSFDVDAVLARVNAKTRIVFIANPNNPTGTYISRTELARLHKGLPQSVLLVIDAAYSEFVQRNDYDPGTELVNAAQNVVMARTFSKIYALAALRLGWAYCSPGVADVLNRVRNPFNVGAAAQAAGIAALEDVAALDRAREHNDIWRPWFACELAAAGLTVVPSVANFVLARFGKDEKTADDAFAFLQSRNIIGRKVKAYGLPEYIRISIGTEAEMREVVAAVKTWMTKS
ncbi:MAG TPA: histidinol-phosphate transaminase [Stellaceae bacterium]|jgi:histidinol-phosphate aminotransferase|nr:histidinol-phosphate transaminase [Stellaceae bacterium]